MPLLKGLNVPLIFKLGSEKVTTNISSQFLVHILILECGILEI